jgi:large subunit ribosomal protein L7/L12
MAESELLTQIQGLPQEERIELLLSLTESMTVLELNALVKAFQDRFDVQPMAAVAAAGPAAAPAAAEEEAEEKTRFDVILTGFGEKKIQVIKAVREVTDPPLGLTQAKELVEGVPRPVRENVPKEEAEEMKKKIEEAGGTVEIK